MAPWSTGTSSWVMPSLAGDMGGCAGEGGEAGPGTDGGSDGDRGEGGKGGGKAGGGGLSGGDVGGMAGVAGEGKYTGRTSGRAVSTMSRMLLCAMPKASSTGASSSIRAFALLTRLAAKSSATVRLAEPAAVRLGNRLSCSSVTVTCSTATSRVAVVVSPSLLATA